MTQIDLVTSIGDTLTKLDTALMSSGLEALPAKWQQVYALRKHLDDEQRLLVQIDIKSDDIDFKTYSTSIATATKLLNQQIGDMTKIDSIINIVAQIAANVDDVLKLAV